MTVRTFKSFFSIFNYKTIIVAIISLASAHMCIRYNIKAEFPFYLISIAIVFPIVFSIDSAYKRREHALQFYADLKGHAISLYLGIREWADVHDPELSSKFKKDLKELFHLISETFMKDPEEAKKDEAEIYRRFSLLSESLVHVKEVGVEGGLMSRLHQYVSKMVVAYGIVRNVFYYRTPITLRAYSKVFIYFFPVLYGPYSASTYTDYSFGIAYVIAVLYSVLLVSLDNLQEHLENPFDQVGEDDINFEVEEMDYLMIEHQKR